jgi:RNA polymerase-binding transcription factor DksA
MAFATFSRQLIDFFRGEIMKTEILNSLTELLRTQRKDYLQEFRQAEENLEAIAAERESELEEHAQEEQSALFLTRLDDRTLFAVKEIDAALERIIKGAYGVCEICHKAITIARLRAVPATRFCKKCAARNETEVVSLGEAPEAPAEAAIPADLNLLSDQDIVETIREHVKEDGRVDLAELRIVTRKGVVHLSGVLPSESEHQILLHIMTDVLGLREIVDRIQVEELVWERDARTRTEPPEVIPPGQERPGTEDIVESHEEGEEFVAPAKPPPDEL